MPQRSKLDAEEDEREGPTATVAPPAPKQEPSVARVLGMQRGMGNAAVARLLARKEGDEEEAVPAPGAGSHASVPLDEAITKRDVGAIVAAAGPDYAKLGKQQKVDAIFVVLQDSKGDPADLDALNSLWWSFEKELPDMMHLYYSTWKACVDKGAKLTRWSLYDMFDLFANEGPDVITTFQVGRVMPAVTKLPDDEYQTFRKKMYFALSGIQRAYIAKALAAGRAMADIATFADAIQMKSDEWLKQNLNVVEEDASGGKGISQQWQMACGPTTVQVLHAQTDPIYALSLRAGGDINKTGTGDVSAAGGNQTMKAEQGTLLQGHGSTPTEIGSSGKGAWVETDINALKAQTGLNYSLVKVTAVEPVNPDGGVIDKALDEIAGYLDDGMYVPIVIGGKPGQTAHYNMLLRHDSSKGFLSHDPAKGSSGWCTRKQFMDNTLAPPLAWKLLAAYDKPSKAT